MAQNLSARDLLDKLVSFPTVSQDSNLDLVDWVQGYLADFGVTAHRVYNADRTKAALYAQIGPPVEGGVIISGHTDVVPVQGQAWDQDPFTVVEKDGKLFGRGVCDMKGFLALALAAVPVALDADLKRPLQIALSYDEEIGCLGAPPMIDHMMAHLPKAAAVIVGEPTMMRAVSGHKGGAGYRVHVHGFEVHSSLLHTGVNAIMEGARLIEWVNQMNVENQAKPVAALAAMFTPPFTTVHVGSISGGTAHNITAKDCQFTVDFRWVPSETLPSWLDRLQGKITEIEVGMQAVHPDSCIRLEPFFNVPALTPETNGAAEKLVRKLTGDNGTHVVSFATEGGQFQERGFSTIVCGPGDIAQAHQPNEYMTTKQFRAGEQFMHRLIDHLS